MDRDASASNGALDVGDNVEIRIVGIQGEGPGIVVSVWTQRDVFDEVSRARWVANTRRCVRRIVRQPGKMVQFVAGLSPLFPDAKAEVSVLRRSCGVHDFGVVAMPYDQSVVDRDG